MTDPDATPAERFDAHLAEDEGRTMRRPGLTRAERRRANAGAFLAIAVVLAIAGLIAWWKR